MTKNTKQDAAKIGAQIEIQSKDIAHKIWLAGVGAYGRAYSEARNGAQKLNVETSDFFDDLVKRGEVIEGSMRNRITSNERLTSASARVAKVADVASRMQKKQRDRLDDRMDRMRTVLGFGKKRDKTANLHARIDRLEEEINARCRKTNSAKPGRKTASPNATIVERIKELTEEIEAITATNAPQPATKKPVVKKSVVKKSGTKQSGTKKTTAKKPANAASKTA